MRTETDPVTGTQAGAAPWGRRSVATRPPGAKSAKTDWLRIRRSWPSQCGASSLPSIGSGSWRRRTGVHGRARSDGSFAVRGCTPRIWPLGARPGVTVRFRAWTPNKRGAKPVEHNPLTPKVRQLEAKVTRLEKELATAHTILDVQGKISGLLGLNLNDAKDC